MRFVWASVLPGGVLWGSGPVSRLPAEFGPGKNLAWCRELPPGHLSPVIFGRPHLSHGIFQGAQAGSQLFVSPAPIC